MTEIIRGEINGSADMLRDDFTAFADDCIFAVGLDATDPDFANGSVRLFSGDDEFYKSITPALDATVLPDLAEVLANASERIKLIAKIPEGRTGKWRIMSRYAQNTPPVLLSHEELPHQDGLLATGAHFTAILACATENDRDHPIAHIYLENKAGGNLLHLMSFHPYWMPTIIKTLSDLAERTPKSGMTR